MQLSFSGDSLIRIAIIGASGYSGAELFRLLVQREDVTIGHVIAHSSTGKRVDELFPALSKRSELVFEPLESLEEDFVDLAFIALPSGEAMNIVPRLMNNVNRIIDLGGDFRLPSVQLYEQFYNHHHTALHLLGEAVYGLPEINKDLIAKARLLANPGCYPTSAILALLPALTSNLISTSGIVINSLSGISGAGRTASLELSFSEVNENIRAYKIGTHQHIPEIQTVLEKATGRPVSVTFVPHLVPLTRGIYTTIYADLTSSFTNQEVLSLYEQFYKAAPFVRIRREIPQAKDVLYTNYCDIAVFVEHRIRKLIIISVIDNLIKGASGQAIQNMNIMYGLPETQGFFPSTFVNHQVREMQHV
ncbi:MAG: N-acetyl-gamma-glutamyl-phosphate reductase [Ignavibacteriae bacterium]|nr:N-acetyl-gamma-glutamyl-phosphate reductase [Ignavibacteriota bacterium]